MPFQKGHPPYPGIEKGQFKKGIIPWSKSQKGIHLSPNSEFKKGNIPWNTGIKREEISNDKHHNWKGDNVGYFALHGWVYRKLGKPELCVHCGSEYDLQWANKSGEYKRDLEDWLSLCIRCHRKYDNWSQKLWKTRKENGL